MKAVHVNRKSQAGVGLVEILVAMVITTVGLLGFASIQSRAMLSTEDSYLRLQALMFAQDMMERMRINGVAPDSQSHARSSAFAAQYTDESKWTGSKPSQACSAAVCSAAQMVDNDIREVRTQVETPNYLPNGSMMTRLCDATLGVCIFVAWGDDTASDCAAQYEAGGTLPRNCVMLEGV